MNYLYRLCWSTFVFKSDPWKVNFLKLKIVFWKYNIYVSANEPKREIFVNRSRWTC